MSTNSNQYKYLARKPKSSYKHLFIKDRWISARTLYGKYAREEEPMTPEEIAADYDLPLEAVREAIAYCESNPPELMEDYAREEARMEASGVNDPNYDGKPKPLTPRKDPGFDAYEAIPGRRQRFCAVGPLATPCRS